MTSKYIEWLLFGSKIELKEKQWGYSYIFFSSK